jgi:cytochrome o ubiquinol oxidase subunit II
VNRDARAGMAWAIRGGGLLALPSLAGCQPAVLNPAGDIGKANVQILTDSVVIMLAIVVPTIAATLAFAWWYRASNRQARRRPNFVYSGQIEMVTWAIPLFTIMLLGGVAWVGSHQLDPARPLPSKTPPINVQVVSLDWKWLFIYPDLHVASVNRLVVPVGTPVHFTLTSSSVMNAFFVPRLGSMIYTMNGMATQLNLVASQPGDFPGLSTHFSGDGFADMHFDVQALPTDGFNAWVGGARGAGPALTSQNYADLARQSQNVAPFTFGDVEPGLFDKIVSQVLPPGPGPADPSPPQGQGKS